MPSKRCTTMTPWGRADNSTQLCRGVVCYDTPGHGGLGVTITWAEQNLTPQARQLGERLYGRLWYEEDCAIAVVLYEHPEISLGLWRRADGSTRTVDEIKASCERTLREYFSEYFDESFRDLCRDNPVNPVLAKGDKVKIGKRTQIFTVTSNLGDRYLVESNGTMFMLRQRVVFESASQIQRVDGSWWFNVNALAERLAQEAEQENAVEAAVS